MGFLDFLKGKSLDNEFVESALTELAPADSTSISFLDDCDELASRSKVLLAFPLDEKQGSDSPSGALLDSLIPLASSVVDAASQFDHAIVKFPDGKHWSNLVDRTSMGDGWKMLNVHGEEHGLGKMGAIKKVGLTGPALANIALQGAAVVVGQAYMNEIDSKLKGLKSSVDSILADMEMQRSAKLKGSFRSLMRYAQRYDEFSADSGKLQAARGDIQGIVREIDGAWEYQVAAMKVLRGDIAGAKKPNEEDIKEMIAKLRTAEANAAAVFQLMACTQQVSMQYDSDFSTKRIERDKAESERMLQQYSDVRGGAYNALIKKVNGLKGAPLLVADASDDSGYAPANPLFGAGHAVVKQVERVTPLAMRGAAKEKNAAKRNELTNVATRAEDMVKSAADAQAEGLARLEVMYNQADAMVIEEGEIRFLKAIDEDDVAAEPDEINGAGGWVPKSLEMAALLEECE